MSDIMPAHSNRKRARLIGVLAVVFATLALVFIPLSAHALAPWSPPINVAEGVNSQAPQLISSTPGQFETVWNDDGIFFAASSNAGVSWSTPIELSTPGATADQPAIAADAAGNIAVAWPELIGSAYEIVVKFSSDGGATWSGRDRISDATLGSATQVSVASSAANSFTVVFTQGHASAPANDIQTRTTNDLGASWTSFTTLSQAGQVGQYSYVTAGSNGTLYVVWCADLTSYQGIQFSKSANHGLSWSTAIDISDAGENAWYPSLVRGPDGTLVAVWYRHNGSVTVAQSTPSTDDGTSFYPISDLSTASAEASNVRIAVDENGLYSVVWHEFFGGSAVIQYAQSDDGALWTTFLDQDVNLSAADGHATSPTLVALPGGGFLAAWSQNGDALVIESRTSVDGLTWDDILELSDANGSSNWPDLATDTAGHVMGVWSYAGPTSAGWGLQGAVTPYDPTLPETGARTVGASGAVVAGFALAIIGALALAVSRSVTRRSR